MASILEHRTCGSLQLRDVSHDLLFRVSTGPRTARSTSSRPSTTWGTTSLRSTPQRVVGFRITRGRQATRVRRTARKAVAALLQSQSQIAITRGSRQWVVECTRCNSMLLGSCESYVACFPSTRSEETSTNATLACGFGAYVSVLAILAPSILTQLSSQRPDIPASITNSTSTSSLDISQWGQPTASYPASSCNISQYFGPQQLVIDITLCGDWSVQRV